MSRIGDLLEKAGAPAQAHEMANLGKNQTGFDKVIYISTREGSHGPRVKLYYKPGKDQPSTSITISDDPKVVADSLKPKKSDVEKVKQFIKLNKDVLLNFWFQGDTMMSDEVETMTSSFKKVS